MCTPVHTTQKPKIWMASDVRPEVLRPKGESNDILSHANASNHAALLEVIEILEIVEEADEYIESEYMDECECIQRQSSRFR